MEIDLYKIPVLGYLAVILLLVKCSVTTINVNLAQYEYLANHMTTDECYRLIASLQMRTYKLNKNFDEAVNDIPNDMSCLSLLIKWNSSPGEGKGQTHKIISHRLLQIGRKDLAQWLEKSVFKELADELRTNDTSTDNPQSDMKHDLKLPSFNSLVDLQDKESANKLTSLILIISIIIITVVGIFSITFCVNFLRHHKKQVESKIISLNTFKSNEEPSEYLQSDEDGFETSENEDYYEDTEVQTPLINDQNHY